MPYLVFLSEAVLISLSGVMAPGPITAVAVGHGIVEFPVMAAVFYGVGRLLQIPYVQPAIGILGAAFLAFMGVGMLRSVWRNDTDLETRDRSPVLAGVVLSLGSPYFLIWWATVGAALVIRSMAFGVVGLLFFGAKLLLDTGLKLLV